MMLASSPLAVISSITAVGRSVYRLSRDCKRNKLNDRGVGGSPDGGSGGNGATNFGQPGFNGSIPGGGGGGHRGAGPVDGRGASGAVRYTLHSASLLASNISFQWF